MSDRDLREAERRWQASGAPADEVAVLLARLRLNEIDHDRLRVASILAHQPAGLALEAAGLEAIRAVEPTAYTSRLVGHNEVLRCVAVGAKPHNARNLGFWLYRLGEHVVARAEEALIEAELLQPGDYRPRDFSTTLRRVAERHPSARVMRVLRKALIGWALGPEHAPTD